MLAELFATRTRREWCELLEDTDTCVTPVLDRDEAPRHPHNVARGSFVEHDGLLQPAPSPRFSRTPGAVADPPPPRGAGGEATALTWGIPAARLHGLRATGVIGADPTAS